MKSVLADMNKTIVAASAAVTISLLPFNVSAQTNQGIQSQREATRAIQAIEESAQIEAEASRYNKIDGGPVSLDEVLRDPDNIKLNYRYAQTQVADGNLRGAAATLERILLINPELSNIRLYYANLLYRLDNMTEARTQLAILEGKRLSDANQEKAEILRSRVERRSKRTTYSANIGAGFNYQNNANFAPEDEAIDVLVPTPIGSIQIVNLETPDSEQEDDTAFFATAGIGFRHDLGYQRGHETFGSLQVIWNEQDQVDSSDYHAVSGNLGIRWRADFADIIGRVILGQFNLDDDDKYLVTSGIEGGLERKYLNDKLSMSASYRGVHEDYDNSDDFSFERTGMRHEYIFGARYLLAPDQRLGGSLTYTDKNADKEWKEYDGWEASVDHTWLLGQGMYVVNQLSYGNEDYSDPDPKISTRTRDDDIFRYRLSFSSPLKSLFSNSTSLPKSIADVRFHASLQYMDNSSNIRNYDYDNTKASVFVTKRFDF